MANNKFDRIIILNEFKGKVISLFSSTKGYCFPMIGSEIYPGEWIPLKIMWFGRFTLQDLGGKPGLRLNVNTPHQKLMLKPLDDLYEVDYSNMKYILHAESEGAEAKKLYIATKRKTRQQTAQG